MFDRIPLKLVTRVHFMQFSCVNPSNVGHRDKKNERRVYLKQDKWIGWWQDGCTPITITRDTILILYPDDTYRWILPKIEFLESNTRRRMNYRKNDSTKIRFKKEKSSLSSSISLCCCQSLHSVNELKEWHDALSWFIIIMITLHQDE